MPKRPPDLRQTVERCADSPERLHALLTAVSEPTVGGRYLHWDELTHRTPPHGLSHEEWWFALKLLRRGLRKAVPLHDSRREPFHYVEIGPIAEAAHKIDLGAGGLIEMPGGIANPETRDRYYVSSLIEEAITSSQLEGATTTRRIASEMIRSGRPPRDPSERMILNNFLTMKHIATLKKEPLSRRLVLELHRHVTTDTLSDPSAAGRLRTSDEPVDVIDDRGRTVHVPPPAGELADRMAAMCEFANADEPFVHPVIRSIILHFWLAYDHPFADGNGRTARALFYWSMLRRGYWLFEFVSVSSVIRKAPAQYGRAFLYTETDDNDLTYFILYHLGVIGRAVDELHRYIRRKTRQLEALEARLHGASGLNYRQRALLSHALRHPHRRYTIRGHQTSHGVVYQTARTDLLDLATRGLMSAEKAGKQWQFKPSPDLERKLRET